MHLHLPGQAERKMFLCAVIVGPLFTFLHEIIHFAFFEIGGIKAHFEKFSKVAPINFPYDFSGLRDAIVHYQSSPKAVFLAAISAPVFTLIVSYIAVVVYRRTHGMLAWILSINPLVFRLLGATAKTPSFLNGNVTKSDEAIAAHFLGIPLTSFLWPSLILGFSCMALLWLSTKKSDRLKSLISTLAGGGLGYWLVEKLVNHFIL